MNAICLVIDRWHAGYVGAYGNSWIETPAIDRLAAEGFVFDQCLIDGPDLAGLCRTWWLGTHALAPPGPAEARGHLARMLAAQGVAATLMTDEEAVASHPLAGGFEEVVALRGPQRAGPAHEVAQTHLAECFAQLIGWLESARPPFCLWCHLKGLGAPWDAPLEFRRGFMEEGDPEPPRSAETPNRVLPDGSDPDEVLGWSQAYAGQVRLLDTCVGALADFLEASRLGHQTVLLLLSARGFALGEHRRLGPCDEALYEELVHVPLILRFPDGLGAAGRSGALVQPGDVPATLLDLWGESPDDLPPTAKSLLPLVREEAEGLRDRMGIVGAGSQRAIATPVWYLRMADSLELFVRPDDRWQVNNVADRCPGVAELLAGAFSQFAEAMQSGQISQIAPLDPALLTPPE